MPSQTFYPDANPETSTVDGYARHQQNQSWANMIADVGTGAGDADVQNYILMQANGGVNWNQYRRLIFLFDTSSLPDNATILTAILTLYGSAKNDTLNTNPRINIYASNPASNIALVAGDYDCLSDIALCDTEIAYADWAVSGVAPVANEFILNPVGIANISKTGISKFGARDPYHDVAGNEPNFGGAWQQSYLGTWLAEKGTGYKPKLVVTYTLEDSIPRRFTIFTPIELDVKINEAEVLILKKTLRLHSELGQRISTATFTIVGEETWSPPSVAAGPLPAIGGFTHPYNLDECKIDRGLFAFQNCAAAPMAALGGYSSYLDHFFGGYLVSVEKTKVGVGDVRVLYHCKAQDYNMLPTKILVTKNYVAQTEQQIIDDLFTTYLPEVDTSTYVESSGATITLDWTRKLLSEAMEELSGIFEKDWYIDYEKYLHYFTPTAGVAPFALSDEPTLSSLIGYKNIRHVEDATKIINKITVVGDPAIPIVVIRTDAASYAEYGRYFEAKYVDSAIDTVAWANAVGDAILAESAFEKATGSLTCYQEGLVKGQKVRVINDFRNVDAFYTIQSLKLSQMAPDILKIDVEYGDYKPRLMDLLLKISKEERKE